MKQFCGVLKSILLFPMLPKCGTFHGHTPPCPLSPSLGSHCCVGSHFWAQRIGAACLAFLRLKVSTSSSTKTLIVPSRPQILDGVKEKRCASRKPHLVSKRWRWWRGEIESRWNFARHVRQPGVDVVDTACKLESCERLMDFLSAKVMGGLSLHLTVTVSGTLCVLSFTCKL